MKLKIEMRSLRKWCLCSVVLISVQMKALAQQKTLNLQTAVETAIMNNLDVKQSGLQEETAEAYLRQARAGMLPTLNGEIDHTWNKGRSLDYSNSYSNQQ